jgi:integrase
VSKKRAHGEGTIFQENTGLWVAEVYLDGKKRRKRSKSQKVVRDWLLIQREAIQKGLWVEDNRLTVGQFLDRYYNDIACHTLRPKTLVSYESIIRLHLKPDLGELRLIQLTPVHLQNLYSKKLNSGLSNRSVQYMILNIKLYLNSN